MALPDRKVLLGIAVGVLCGMGIAAIGPGAIVSVFADETRTGIDPDGLVKFNDRSYDVQYDDSVDTTPITKSRIKKVEFGKVSYVDITTTATGTYSTDAMFSDNIEYPGIDVKEVASNNSGPISVIGRGGNWMVLPLVEGNSFVHIRGRGHSTFSGSGVTCFSGRYSTGC